MKRLPVHAAAMAWPSEVVAQGVKATVLSIGDGDTIRVRQAGKALTVRLACTYLQQRLPIGREVSLNIKTTDRYGRSDAEITARPSLIWRWWKPVWHSRIGST